MELEYLSASRIKTYQQCPMKYRAVYELKVPKETPHHLTRMGSAVHRMLENAANARMADPSGPGCDPMVHKKGAMAEYAVEAADGPLIDELVANAVRWGYFRNLSRTAGCEVEFLFSLSDDTRVKGYIDRLDLLPPGADIIDIKTQKNQFEERELVDNWQAAIYNIAAREMHPEVTGKVSVSFWVLRHQVQKAWLTAHDAAAARERLAAVAREIRACCDPEARPSALCAYCEYRSRCPDAGKGGSLRRNSWARRARK